MQHLLPELAFVDGELRPGVAVSVGDDGRIAAVGPAPSGEVTRLPHRALLPGFVNVHSHAFQRAIRGRTEWRVPGHASDDFWSWREQMYAAALALTPEDVEAVSRMAFVEMALSGITTVGEFHYLHHQADGTPYAEPDELAHRVLAAAADAGISIVLLRVAYARAGHGRPAQARQLRFVDPSPDRSLEAIDRLAARGVAVGVAPHSVRAVPLSWLRTLGAAARQRGLPFHLHLSEQPRELSECEAEHGATPGELLRREGLLDQRFTGIHGVHLRPGEIAALGAAGATIGACPTTERNLGDGIVPARALLDAGVQLALGTDSQVQLAPLEDARQLEYHLRLSVLQRAVLGAEGGDAGPAALATRLLACATSAGARSLLAPTGSLEPGRRADLIAIDLDDPSICGAEGATLLPAIVFSLERPAIRDVWAAGRRIVTDGRHPGEPAARAAFLTTMRRLWA